MMHRLATNYAKNYCNRTPIVKVIVENVVTCFFGTQCINISSSSSTLLLQIIHYAMTGNPRRHHTHFLDDQYINFNFNENWGKGQCQVLLSGAWYRERQSVWGTRMLDPLRCTRNYVSVYHRR